MAAGAMTVVDIYDTLARAQEAYLFQYTVQSGSSGRVGGPQPQGKSNKVVEGKLDDSDSKAVAGGRPREGDKGAGEKGAGEKGLGDGNNNNNDDDDDEDRDSPPRPSAAWKEVVVVEQVGMGTGSDHQMTKLTVALSFPGDTAKIPLVWTASISSLRQPPSPANANTNASAAVATAAPGAAAQISDEERVDGWMLELRRLVQNSQQSMTDHLAAPKGPGREREGPSASGQGLGRQAKS